MTDWGEEVFRVRTLYNVRRCVREHAEKTGENLFAKVFDQVTDAQLKAVDDGELLKHWLERQSVRDVALEEMTTDGGYTGPRAESACEEHQTELRPTRIRDGKSGSDRPGWEDYE